MAPLWWRDGHSRIALPVAYMDGEGLILLEFITYYVDCICLVIYTVFLVTLFSSLKGSIEEMKARCVNYRIN